MKGVILAAGRGSRLGEATTAVPKPLVPVAGRPCIDFAIDALTAVADDIIIVTGYRAESVEAHVREHPAAARVRTVRNPAPEAGNLTSLLTARGLIGDSAFVLTNADHLFPPEMYLHYFRPGTTGVRVACERERPIQHDEMKVIEDAGRLRAISKTLPTYDGAYIGTTAVNAGARADYWAAFDRVLAASDLATASVEMVLGELARSAATAPAVHWLSGLRWFEVDTPEDLALAREGLAP